MHKEIHLAMPENEYGGCPVSAPPMQDTKEYYPELTYVSEYELDIPDDGVMTVRYRTVRQSDEVRNGKHRHSCTVEITDILSAKEENGSKAPAKSGNETRDALDKLAEEAAKHLEEDSQEIKEDSGEDEEHADEDADLARRIRSVLNSY